MLDFIAKPLGQFLYLIYNTVAFENYGIALVIFTIAIKLVLLPLTVKQYKSTTEMQKIQPQIQEVQKRYKNDKEKLNQELMNLYKEHKVNPAGGCLPLLIQMPILFSLFYVIREPLTYVLGMDRTKIFEIAKGLDSVKNSLSNMKIDINTITSYSELVKKMPYLEVNVVNEYLENGKRLLNMDFLGIFHLGVVPTWRPEILFGPQKLLYLPLILIPLVSVATTYLSTKLMSVKSVSATDTNNTAAAMQKNMLYLGPAMTLIFSFQFPAGLGLYWIISNIVQIFQQMYINKHVLKKEEVSK